MKVGEDDVKVDWLRINQQHHERIPEVTAGIVQDVDAETGEIKITPKPVQIAAPGGGTLRIKSYAGRVYIEGNPSHWNRMDNIDGVEIEEAKAIYNAILKNFGIPAFDQDATISRMDLCVDVVTGSPMAKLQYLFEKQEREFPRLRKTLDGKTTYYGKGSASRTFRIYDKAEEVAAKAKKEKDPRKGRHLEMLAAWAENSGIVRCEIQMRNYLQRRQIDGLSISQSIAVENIRPDMEKIMETTQRQNMEEMLSKKARLCYIAWKANAPVKELVGKNQYYAYRREILEKTGDDIGHAYPKMLNLEPEVIPIRALKREDIPEDLRG